MKGVLAKDSLGLGSMDSFYLLLFVAFAIPAAVLEYTQNGCFGQLSELPHMQQGAAKAQYLRFRNNYVLVFSLMMGECCVV